MNSWTNDPETRGCQTEGGVELDERHVSHLPVCLVSSDTDKFWGGLHVKLAFAAVTDLSRSKLRQVCLETIVKDGAFPSSGLLSCDAAAACAGTSQPFSRPPFR